MKCRSDYHQAGINVYEYETVKDTSILAKNGEKENNDR